MAINKDEIGKIERRIATLRYEIAEIESRIADGDSDFSLVLDRHDKIAEAWDLEVELNRMRREMAESIYVRPNGGFYGLFSGPLGDLPEDATIVHPTKEALSEVPSYRAQALLLVIGAIGLLISLATQFPWLAVSPAMLINTSFSAMFGDTAGGILSVAAVIGLIVALGSRTSGTSYSKYQGKLWDRAAMFEEQWFRMGAEAWTFRQRVYSCISFGLMHIGNIVYPSASIIVLTLVGVVFLSAYLREYHRSGDTRRAVLASSKLHAAYNRFALLYIAVALGLAVFVL